MFYSNTLIRVLLVLLLLPCLADVYAQKSKIADGFHVDPNLFIKQKFGAQDSIFVTNSADHTLYQWQADRPLIPASLTKLITAYLAIEKWGVDYRFTTEFYLLGSQLWIKGYGDPYLVSEELDLIVAQIDAALEGCEGAIESINVDSNFFTSESVPGRTQVTDPYNAPLSAVAANFNTVMLQRKDGLLLSAEAQTPITETAQNIAKIFPQAIGEQASRVNLVDETYAQQHFAEILSIKLSQSGESVHSNASKKIFVNQTLPPQARLILRHKNSRTLAQVMRGALEYSNNFIANQVFLLLGDEIDGEQLSFAKSDDYVKRTMASMFSGIHPEIHDGAGLTRANKVTARQINQILTELKPHQKLLKRYSLKSPTGVSVPSVYAHAKTGTLNGVHSFAGFLSIDQSQYQFVFIFNRQTPYRYRERLLQLLANQITD